MSEIVTGPVFDIGWEWKAGIDVCAHDWQPIQYRAYPGGPVGTVEKCTRCGVPRCISRNDSGSCVDRRHHDSVHVYPDGEFQPLGGYLPADVEFGGRDA